MQTIEDISKLPLPPGKMGLPVIGETLEFATNTWGFIARHQQQYGNVFATHVLGAPTVFMIGPEANRWIFAGEDKYLQNQWTAGIRQLLGAQSLALINGEAHRERRRLLLPHFSQDSMRHFVPKIQAIAERHLAQWAEQPQPLTIFPAMQALVFEIAIALILGDDDVDQPYLSRLFQDWTAGLFTLVPWNVPFTTFGRAMKARTAMFGYVEQLVRRRMQRAEQPNDILGSLINTRDTNGQPLSVAAIVDDIQLLLFAGHDTTVSATSNMLLLFAQHPNVLAKARAEQAEFDQAAPLSHDAFRRMPYLLACINENLRFISPINGAFRVTTQDVAYGGYRIPQGWTVALSIRGTHHNAPWDAADRFEPERWMGESRPATGAFIPFGGGPRVCLGTNFALVEMSVVLALLLRNYQWDLTPEQDLKFIALPLPHPKSGIQVRFSRR
jgi:cytochrome P450